MRQFEFLFLDRNWQADKRRVYRCVLFVGNLCFGRVTTHYCGWMALSDGTNTPTIPTNPPNRLLGSFVEDGYEACLLIFPEGTTVNTRTFDKSRAFAVGKQRPELNHLVLPRCVQWIDRLCGVVVCGGVDG